MTSTQEESLEAMTDPETAVTMSTPGRLDTLAPQRHKIAVLSLKCKVALSLDVADLCREESPS